MRDDATDEFWSPSWSPVRTDVEDYRRRHGLGYTAIGSARHGIEAETLYLVPLGRTHEVWRTRIVNRRDERADLSLFGAVEFCLWDAWDDQTNYQRNLSTGEVEVADGAIHHVTEYRERRNHFAYFAFRAGRGVDTQREDFLGANRGWDRPVAVERGACAGSIAHGWAPIGAHHVRLTLSRARPATSYSSWATRRTRPTRSSTRPIRAGRPPRRPRPARRRAPRRRGRRGARPVRDHWADMLEILQVETPDRHVDRMVNVWTPYQCMATFNLGRSASSFDTGSAAIGFRDSSQTCSGSCDRAGAGTGTAPGPGGDPAPERRGLPPVPTAHETRQRRDRLGLQRRSAVARSSRSRPTSRRPATPRSWTSRSCTTTSRDPRRRCTSTCVGPPGTRSSVSARTASCRSVAPTGTTV